MLFAIGCLRKSIQQTGYSKSRYTGFTSNSSLQHTGFGGWLIPLPAILQPASQPGLRCTRYQKPTGSELSFHVIPFFAVGPKPAPHLLVFSIAGTAIFGGLKRGRYVAGWFAQKRTGYVKYRSIDSMGYQKHIYFLLSTIKANTMPG